MNEAMNWLGSVKARAIALLAIVFVIGALLGAAGSFALMVHHLHGGPRGMPMAMADAMGPHQLPPGFERLDLTDAQRTRIQAILDSVRPHTDSIMRATMPRLRAITDSARAEIHKVLTPAQLDQLDRDRRARGFGPNDHPGMPGFGGPGQMGGPPPAAPPGGR